MPSKFYNQCFNEIFSTAFTAVETLGAAEKIYPVLEECIRVTHGIDLETMEGPLKKYSDHALDLIASAKKIIDILSETVKAANRDSNDDKKTLARNNQLEFYIKNINAALKNIASINAANTKIAVNQLHLDVTKKAANRFIPHNPANTKIDLPFYLALTDENIRRLNACKLKAEKKTNKRSTSAPHPLPSNRFSAWTKLFSRENEKTPLLKKTSTTTTNSLDDPQETRTPSKQELPSEKRASGGSDSSDSSDSEDQKEEQQHQIKLDSYPGTDDEGPSLVELEGEPPLVELEEDTTLNDPSPSEEKISEITSKEKYELYVTMNSDWRDFLQYIFKANAEKPKRTWPQFWKMLFFKSLVMLPLFAGFIILGVFTGKILIAPLLQSGVLFDAAAELGPLAKDYPTSYQLMEEALDNFLRLLGIDAGLNYVYLAFGLYSEAHKFNEDQVLQNRTVRILREMAAAVLQTEKTDSQNNPEEELVEIPLNETVDTTPSIMDFFKQLEASASKGVDRLLGRKKEKKEEKRKKNYENNTIKLSPLKFVKQLALLRLQAHKRGNPTESLYIDDAIIEIFVLAHNGFDDHIATSYSTNYFRTGLLTREWRQGMAGNPELAKQRFSQYLDALYALDKKAYVEITRKITAALETRLQDNAKGSICDELISGLEKEKKLEEEALKTFDKLLEKKRNDILKRKPDNMDFSNPVESANTNQTREIELDELKSLMQPTEEKTERHYAIWCLIEEGILTNQVEKDALYKILNYNTERSSTLSRFLKATATLVTSVFLLPWISSEILQSIGDGIVGKGDGKQDGFQILADKFDSINKAEYLLPASVGKISLLWVNFKALLLGWNYLRQNYIARNNNQAVCALLAGKIVSEETYELDKDTHIKSSTVVSYFLWKYLLDVTRSSDNLYKAATAAESAGLVLFLAARGIKRADELKFEEDKQRYMPVPSEKQGEFQGKPKASFEVFKTLVGSLAEELETSLPSKPEKGFKDVIKRAGQVIESFLPGDRSLEPGTASIANKIYASQKTSSTSAGISLASRQLRIVIASYMNAEPPKPVSKASNWTSGLTDWFSRKDKSETERTILTKAGFINDLFQFVNQLKDRSAGQADTKKQYGLLIEALKDLKNHEQKNLKKWKKIFDQMKSPAEDIRSASQYIQKLIDGSFFEGNTVNESEESKAGDALSSNFDPSTTIAPPEIPSETTEEAPESSGEKEEEEEEIPLTRATTITPEHTTESEKEEEEEEKLETDPEVEDALEKLAEQVGSEEPQPTIPAEILSFEVPDLGNIKTHLQLLQNASLNPLPEPDPEDSKQEIDHLTNIQDIRLDLAQPKDRDLFKTVAGSIFNQILAFNPGRTAKPEDKPKSNADQFGLMQQLTTIISEKSSAFTEIHGKLTSDGTNWGFKDLLKEALKNPNSRSKKSPTNVENQLLSIFSTAPNPYLFRLLLEEKDGPNGKQSRLPLLMSNTIKKPLFDLETLLKYLWEYCKDTLTHEKSRKSETTKLDSMVEIKNFVARAINLFFGLPWDYYREIIKKNKTAAKKNNLLDTSLWEELIQAFIEGIAKNFPEEKDALRFKWAFLNDFHKCLTHPIGNFEDPILANQSKTLLEKLAPIVQSEKAKFYLEKTGSYFSLLGKKEVPEDDKSQRLEQLQLFETFINNDPQDTICFATIINLMTDPTVVDQDTFEAILNREELREVFVKHANWFLKLTADEIRSTPHLMEFFAENLYTKYMAGEKTSGQRLSVASSSFFGNQNSGRVDQAINAIKRLSRFSAKLGSGHAGFFQNYLFTSLTTLKHKSGNHEKFVKLLNKKKGPEPTDNGDPGNLLAWIPGGSESHSASFQGNP